MALIQSVGLSGAVSSSATISSSQVGSTIIVLVGTSGANPSSVTDNLGTTYTKLTIDATQYCFYGKPASAGVTTVTINGSFGNGIAFINEESGLVSNPLDSISIGYNNSSGGTTWITNSVNVGTSSGVGYVFTQYLGGPGMTGFGVDSPWTILSGTGITGGTVTNSGYGSQAGAGRRTISAPGTYSGTGFTGTTWYPFTYVVFFKYVDTPRTKFIDPTLVNITGISAGTWTKYNLNGIVQPGATGAMFNVIRSGSGAQVVNLRKFGSTDNYVGITLSGSSQNFLICGLDSSLQFELYTNDASIQLYCIGYFNDEASFFTNSQVLTPTLTTSWVDYDISSYVPTNAKAAIVTTDLNSYNVSVRVKGSTDSLGNGNESTNKKYLIVGLDGNKIFQAAGYTPSGSKLLLVGYITDGIVWNTNAIQRTISSNNTFTLLPTSATAAGYLYHLNSPSGGSTSLSCTLRKSGNYSYDPNTFYTAGSTQVSVGPFPEFKTANTADQFIYELGYFTSPGMRMLSNNVVKVTNIVEQAYSNPITKVTQNYWENTTSPYSISPTAGNMLVFSVLSTIGGGDPYITSLQTNTGQNFISAIGTSFTLSSTISTTFGAGTWYMSHYYLPVVGSGVTSISASYNNGGSGTLNVLITEFSGMGSSPFLRAVYGKLSGTFTSDPVYANALVSDGVPASLVYAHASTSDNTNGMNATGSGWTQILGGTGLRTAASYAKSSASGTTSYSAGFDPVGTNNDGIYITQIEFGSSNLNNLTKFDFSEANNTKLNTINPAFVGQSSSLYTNGSGQLTSPTGSDSYFAVYGKGFKYNQSVEITKTNSSTVEGLVSLHVDPKLTTSSSLYASGYSYRLGSSTQVYLYRNGTFVDNWNHGVTPTTSTVNWKAESIAQANGSLILNFYVNSTLSRSYTDNYPLPVGKPAFVLGYVASGSGDTIDLAIFGGEAPKSQLYANGTFVIGEYIEN